MSLSFERVLAELGETFSQPPLEPAAGTDSGVVNAYVYTHSGPLIATLSSGTLIRFTPAHTNTGASTINVNGTGVVAIVGVTNAALVGGELSSLGPVMLQYNGTAWQIIATTGTTPIFGATGAGTESGAVNAYIYTHNSYSLPATLSAGTLIRFIPLNTNTGAVTVNADGTGAVAAVRANGTPCTGGELSSLGPVVLQSTGTQWQIVSTAGAQPGYERTPAETTAAVIPTNYQFLPYYSQRYMSAAQLADYLAGTALVDQTSAFTTAEAVAFLGGVGVIRAPAGSYLFQGTVTLRSGVLVVGDMIASEYYINSPWNTIQSTRFWKTQAGTAGPIFIFQTASGVSRAYLRHDLIGGQGTGVIQIGTTSHAGSGDSTFKCVLDKVHIYGAAINAFTFTGALLANATSATLSTNWTQPSGVYLVRFSDGECRSVTLTKNATTATWTGGLTSGVTAAFNVLDTASTGIYFYNGSVVNTTQRYFSKFDAFVTNCYNGLVLGENCNGNIFNVSTRDCYNHFVLSGNGQPASCVENAFYGFNSSNIGTKPTVLISFTGGLAAAATSGTLSTAWVGATGNFGCAFSDGEVRLITLTNGATTATWGQPLNAAVTSALTALVTIVFTLGNYAINNSFAGYATEANGAAFAIDPATAITPQIPLTFTGGLLSTAVSGTLTFNWPFPTGAYIVFFSDGEQRSVTLTNGATTATWAGGLTNNVTANANVQGVPAGQIALTFTAGFAVNAVSGTLTANWNYPTGAYAVIFSDSEQRLVTLTNGATTATWTTGLTGTPTANANVGGFAILASAWPLPTAFNYVINLNDGEVLQNVTLTQGSTVATWYTPTSASVAGAAVVQSTCQNNNFMGYENEIYLSVVPPGNFHATWQQPRNRSSYRSDIIPAVSAPVTYQTGTGVSMRWRVNVSGTLPQLAGSGALLAADVNSKVFARFPTSFYAKAQKPVLRCKLYVRLGTPGGGVGDSIVEVEFDYLAFDNATPTGLLSVSKVRRTGRGSYIAGLKFLTGVASGLGFGLAVVGGNIAAVSANQLFVALDIEAVTHDTNTVQLSPLENISWGCMPATANDVTDALDLLTVADTNV